jgi:hypothetical protein
MARNGSRPFVLALLHIPRPRLESLCALFFPLRFSTYTPAFPELGKAESPIEANTRWARKELLDLPELELEEVRSTHPPMHLPLLRVFLFSCTHVSHGIAHSSSLPNPYMHATVSSWLLPCTRIKLTCVCPSMSSWAGTTWTGGTHIS